MSYVTENGKELKAVLTPRGEVKIHFTSGGELPQDLSGIYTSMALANKAIEKYLLLRCGESQESSKKSTQKAK